ncbi:uncharacterized protein LOC131880131 isoform X2 [Tigriopus californicus]|uniref:uncharacterized protein LOC131880131 isoform X2 n=1 Tax=Tigriopus californicus TaxID=6832 RepID=UPI0027D9FFFD|nr:uncharacterized protein LOC131880131 isoform X2 [Tigriopus californicus]
MARKTNSFHLTCHSLNMQSSRGNRGHLEEGTRSPKAREVNNKTSPAAETLLLDEEIEVEKSITRRSAQDLARSQTNSKSNKSPGTTLLKCLGGSSSHEASLEQENEHHVIAKPSLNLTLPAEHTHLIKKDGRTRSLIELPNRIRSGPSSAKGRCSKGPPEKSVRRPLKSKSEAGNMAQHQSDLNYPIINKKKSSNPIKSLIQKMTPKPNRKKMEPVGPDPQTITFMTPKDPGGSKSKASTPSVSQTNTLTTENHNYHQPNVSLEPDILSWETHKDEAKANDGVELNHPLQDSMTNPDSIEAGQESVPNESSTLNTNQDQHPEEPRSPSESEDLKRFMSDTQGHQDHHDEEADKKRGEAKEKKEEEEKPYLETDLDLVEHPEPVDEWRILAKKLQVEAKGLAGEGLESLSSSEENEGLAKKVGRSMSVIMKKISEHEEKIQKLEARERSHSFSEERSSSLPMFSTIVPLTLLGGLSAMYFMGRKS